MPCARTSTHAVSYPQHPLARLRHRVVNSTACGEHVSNTDHALFELLCTHSDALIPHVAGLHPSSECTGQTDRTNVRCRAWRQFLPSAVIYACAWHARYDALGHTALTALACCSKLFYVVIHDIIRRMHVLPIQFTFSSDVTPCPRWFGESTRCFACVRCPCQAHCMTDMAFRLCNIDADMARTCVRQLKPRSIACTWISRQLLNDRTRRGVQHRIYRHGDFAELARWAMHVNLAMHIRPHGGACVRALRDYVGRLLTSEYMYERCTPSFIEFILSSP